MQGDYSRVTFDPKRHFTKVLMQQGRVLLDADYNEQTAILLHYLRQLAADVIGPHGGPAHDLGFAIGVSSAQGKINGLTIGSGRYWVDGFLCENEGDIKYSEQLPDKQHTKLGDLKFPLLVYLDVWERHITSVEDPRIREVALGGPDTSARMQLVWRIRVLELTIKPGIPNFLDCLTFETSDPWKGIITRPANLGTLTAWTDPGTVPATPCITSPESRYRGENQLYRVEIHHGGPEGEATFKWSRENAHVIFPIESIAETLVTVEHLGRDDRYGLEIGDWVEVVDDDTALDARNAEPEQLFQVEDIDTTELIVTLNGKPQAGGVASKHPFLRRWDHQEGNPSKGGLTLNETGAAKIDEGKPLNLENGIQIRFESHTPNAVYRAGDYWLIAARTATGDIEWPLDGANKPLPQRPHGVEHHYAPLGIVITDAAGAISVTDLRHTIDPVASCCPRVAVIQEPLNDDNVKFVAVVHPPLPGLRFHWTASVPVPGATDKDSLVVPLVKGFGRFVTATVVVEGFPDGCANSASGTAFKK
ncbi:MAG: hypothetical protein QOK37_3625 [Thermoanaerobaculia bacterium]|jgi:hypothetical protein|nr:hypothetical protein [Thermoanaerobaculia bacterium]